MGKEEPAQGEPAKEGHPHQNEEWYQKWLRRQENKNRQIIDIGKPQEPEAPPVAELPASCSAAEGDTVDGIEGVRRVCPDDGKEYTFEELKVAFAGEYSAEDLQAYWRDTMKPPGQESQSSAETGRKGYEHEEWYQKWLRRQKNKDRQIIEIG
eukprot:NODE_4018_length_718_cov_298.315234.p2 GENE.NODE_4018_length_718_cov_298.315234~~NODE_4018_length_718_cov_298.315234.p2  ORF type:complete len:153 (+),score=48.75 NODE_4018_length_718_cov_298.315234:3-461(+)